MNTLSPTRRGLLLGLTVIGAFFLLVLPSQRPVSSSMLKTSPSFSLAPSFGRQTGRRYPSRIYELVQFMREELTSPTSRLLLDRLYSVEEHKGQLKIPELFAPRVRNMFAAYPGGVSDLSFVEKQTVLNIRNRYTNEHSMFNEVRRYRPGYQEKMSPAADATLQEQINSSKGADKCDFCARRTSQEVFGTIQGQHCYIASNVAKYAGWHGVIVALEHSPYTFSAEAVEDYIASSYLWFQSVRNLDPLMTHPHLMWDAGPKASASQMHQHMQLIMTKEKYLTRGESTYMDAIRYELKHPHSNFWTDMAIAHDTVGLAVRYKNCALMSHLSPIKEREIIVVCANGADPAFAKLLHVGLRTLVDDMGTRAFSAGITFEIQSPTSLDTHYPAVARVVDRGSPFDQRSDVGAMEFFGSYNVGADPYQVMPYLRDRVASL